ncbi:OmpA family protein [Aquimarina brevivitae]|uniref:OmpA family protein n=1 Tax=Aquimarina brevivitae TaxID=323412 RepID=A0A4Q7PI58_9FLAO|nr:OmpA family protein [Aquimarina brevivitae]RZT00255.1 OmpA family protein [Aquimarina brevivitae]
MNSPKFTFYLLAILCLVFNSTTTAQTLEHTTNENLLPNPSFENINEVSRLTHEMQNFEIMADWKPAINSPDVHHPYANEVKYYHIAPGFLKQFGPQKPRSGEGKVGMYIAGGAYKEGITAKLKQTLKKGAFYYFHIYVSLAEGVSNSCTSSIGGYFSARDPKITLTSRLPLHVQSSKMVCDAQGWTKVCGVYRAKGNEQYLSIGYFGEDPRGKSLRSGGEYSDAYYYVDDVLLMEMYNPEGLDAGVVCNMALDFEPIEFLEGEYETYNEIKKGLDKYIQYVKIFKVNTIKIIGHADDAGTPYENEIMSAVRAIRVKNYFVEQGIDEALIEIIAKGDTAPIVTEDSDLDPTSNNRVEIKIE